MIQATELRIGNKIKSGENGDIITISGVFKTKGNYHVSYFKNQQDYDLGGWLHACEPVLLTSEILKLAGFKIHSKIKKAQHSLWTFASNKYFPLIKQSGNAFTVVWDKESDKQQGLKGLHHLQNLFFDLTGQEFPSSP